MKVLSMQNSTFFNFLSLLIYRHKSKHIAIFIISTLIVSLLATILFVSSSIKRDALSVVSANADFTIQKLVAGESSLIDISLADKISDIRGVSSVSPRVYGKYFMPNGKNYFRIIGIDLFNEQLNQNLRKLFKDLDIKEFLQKNNMIVGAGVKKHLEQNYYKEYFNFSLQNGEKRKVHIYKTIPNDKNLISNDIILMEVDLAREILNIDENLATDITLNVPNDAERDNIKFKLLSLSYDTRVTSKDEIKEEYEHLFNYKSGIFLLLFLVVFFTFMLILFQRYSMINSSDKKEIAILRSVGWSIKDVLKLKVTETLIVGLFAFLLGLLIAFVFVFLLDAPLVKDIFLGFNNLSNDVSFTPVFDIGLIGSLFIFFIVPFVISVLIPVWKISITDPNEAMK
jgi:ABC-type lipoprotein release transport system permease subunit